MVAHGVKVAGVVGDGVAVSVCALGVVLVWLIMARAAQIVARVWRSVWRVCS